MKDAPVLANAKVLCGARARTGQPCKRLPMVNGRCRFHGGCSTGPRTAEGIERIRAARTVHGGYGADAAKLRDLVCELRAGAKRLVEIV